uniref:Uncharacterized protein n=1 Tax=Rhizophagus irregularis (strain DAOM 181602 / DAOM 197198 / MUCL 43194) TaxID=747089 RepID=U9U6U3_RHIID
MEPEMYDIYKRLEYVLILLTTGSLQEQTPGNTSSSSVTPYTVAPYHPIPDMFIPHKYRDIIPPDPIWLELRLAADKESAAERLRIQQLEYYRRALKNFIFFFENLSTNFVE